MAARGRGVDLELPFPVGGINRDGSYFAQPPLTTVDAVNVRPYSVGTTFDSEMESRARGGSRPGLGKAYTQDFGAPIRLLHSIHLAQDESLHQWLDDFTGDELRSLWKALAVKYRVGIASITRSGSTATVTTDANHNLITGNVIRITGADQADYNGTFEVTVTGDTTFTYSVANSPTTPATGTMVAWKEFPTNVAVASITRSGGTATATTTDNHRFTSGMQVEIKGAGQSQYNGIKVVTVTSPTTFTYSVSGSPATPATGTITAEKVHLPNIYPDDPDDVVQNEMSGAVRDLLEFDYSQPYTLELFIQPNGGKHHGRYWIFARMDDTAPAPYSNGVVAELIQTGTGGNYSGTLRVYVAGVETSYDFTAGSDSSPESGSYRMVVFGNRIRVYWRDALLVDQVVSAAAGRRFGYGSVVTEAAGITRIDFFRATYLPAAPVAYVDRLVVLAVAGGRLYREVENLFTMEAVPSEVTLSTDKQLCAANLGGKVYIADYAPVVARGTATVDATGKNVTSTDVVNWSALSIDPNQHVLVVTNPQGNVKAGTYRISQVTTDVLVLSRDIGDGTATFRVEKAPVVYDPLRNTLEIWETEEDDDNELKGGVPCGCPLIALYRNRLVMGGAETAPNVWFMPRQGNPKDFDYSQEDAGAAISGQSAQAGIISEPLKAIAPWKDDFLIQGTTSTLWLFRGDPGFGGSINNLSMKVGIVGQKAWCYLPDGSLLFFSWDGIYMLPPGGGETSLKNVSVGKVSELLSISDDFRDEYEVFMEYDVADGGVHIFIVDTKSEDPREGSHLWWDLATDSFWRVVVPQDMEPTSLHAVDARWRSDSAVLIGGRDGFVRCYRDAFQDDDGQDVEAHVTLGPYWLEQYQQEVIVNELTATMARDSKGVRWELWGGDSPEEAYHALPVFADGLWVAGTNYTERPRMRARAFFLKLSSSSSGLPWAMEQVQVRGAAVSSQGLRKL
jgi:hypothetical protein